jgi:hypothetical protein
VSVYKEVLNTYLSFMMPRQKLKASLHNKVGIVTAEDNLVKLPDLQSSMV